MKGKTTYETYATYATGDSTYQYKTHSMASKSNLRHTCKYYGSSHSLSVAPSSVARYYKALQSTKTHKKTALQSLHFLKCLGQENPSLDSSPGILVGGADTTLALTELALTEH